MNPDSISQYRRDQTLNYPPIFAGGHIARSGLDTLPQDVLEDLGRGDLDSVKAKLDLLKAKKDRTSLIRNNPFSKLVDKTIRRVSKALSNLIEQLAKKAGARKVIKKGDGLTLEQTLAKLQATKMQGPRTSVDLSTKLKDLAQALAFPVVALSKVLSNLFNQLGKHTKNAFDEALNKVLQAGSKAMTPFKKGVDKTLAIITSVVAPPARFCKEIAKHIQKKFQEGSEKLNKIVGDVVNTIADQIKVPLDKIKTFFKDQTEKVTEFASSKIQSTTQIAHQVGAAVAGFMVPIVSNVFQSGINLGLKYGREAKKKTKGIGSKLKEWSKPFASFTNKSAHVFANAVVETVYKSAFIFSWLMHKLLVLLTLFISWARFHTAKIWLNVRQVFSGIYFWVPELTKVIGILLFRGFTLLPITLYRVLFRK